MRRLVVLSFITLDRVMQAPGGPNEDPSGGFVHGSRNLIQTLLAHDLVDEFWLKVFPVVLGTGKRLFAGGTIPAVFTLEESTISPHGVVAANWRCAGEVTTGSF